MATFRQKLNVLGDLGNFIAAVGVIFSLLIVAWQIGENTDTVRAEANLSLANMLSGWAEWRTDPDFAELLVRAEQGLDELTVVEQMQYRTYVFQIFNTWEAAFLFQEEGLLDEEQWIPWDRAMFRRLNSREIRAMWEDAQDRYRASFAAHVNLKYSED